MTEEELKESVVPDAKSDYQMFIENYLMPLIGINSEVEDCDADFEEIKPNQYKMVQKPIPGSDFRLVFYAAGKPRFMVKVPRTITEDVQSVIDKILSKYSTVARYWFDRPNSKTKRNVYLTESMFHDVLKDTVQTGICDWASGNQINKESLAKLLETLEKWSVKTYEGKKVTFGFIIDPRTELSKELKEEEWFSFLEDEYAASLSDCITSVILLDKNCTFSKYISVTKPLTAAAAGQGETGNVNGYEMKYTMPYRFAHVMSMTSDKGDALGVFLLNNGDIVIFKNGEIKFIKRNLKWLNFSFYSFESAVRKVFEPGELSDELVQSIYSSVLDVSFSHTGGIIAVVKKDPKLSGLLSPSDDRGNKSGDDRLEQALRKINKDISKYEIDKRLLKRKVLSCLLMGEDYFPRMDRKLRSELIAMDGACIMFTDGELKAAGAIIQNESGSSGGGRAAAAKQLSRFGLACKISTDGYVEVFDNTQTILTIK